MVGGVLCAPLSAEARSAGASALAGHAETEPGTRDSSNVAVFIDCNTGGCDFDYFRRSIRFVRYVRARQQAGVHVLITSQEAGSGRAYRLRFIGREGFSDSDFTLRYDASQTATDDDIRRGLARVLKAGLVRFVAATPARDRLKISYDAPQDTAASSSAPRTDPWNFWVFEVSAGGSFRGESQTGRRSMRGSVEASRTTETWKANIDTDADFRFERFSIDDTTITNRQQQYRGEASAVYSLGPHWSVGGFVSARRSTFDNYDFRFRLNPALEYNLFPYAESSQRQLRFLYRVGVSRANYRDRTLFGRLQETRFRESLGVAFELQQPWGSVNSSLEGSHFFYDLDRHRLEFSTGLEVNVVEGLAFDVFSSVSLIRDQLNLPASETSREDILLRRRQLATDFEYRVFFGISYTFGSVNNSIVNPRFGG